MMEIEARGPVLCRLHATDRFVDLKEGHGVLVPDPADKWLNKSHAIAVVGWGELDAEAETGIPPVRYWVKAIIRVTLSHLCIVPA